MTASNDKKKKDFSLESIFNLNLELTKKDREIIKKAYLFAKSKHEGQVRQSGDPYFYHLVATAQNLSNLGMDGIVISAGLLHDSIEDGAATREEIEKVFGVEILFLVEGVTKLGHIKYRGMRRHNESLRKLFVATSQDIRVLIIKFADRLHNLTTLDFLPREKQIRIATESLEIYTQLAYRLGITTLSKALGDLSFKYVFPEKYRKIRNILKERSKENKRNLEQVSRSITKKLVAAKIKKFKLTSRTKAIVSLYKKLIKKKWHAENVYDIIALRIIVPTVGDCYKVLGVIHKNFKPMAGRIKDYIALPKPNGYQSIHTTIFTGHGGVVEVQIRTDKMHAEAEYGAASHLGYKAKQMGLKYNSQDSDWVSKVFRVFSKKQEVGKDDKKNKIKWIQELAEHSDNPEAFDFETRLKDDFFSDRIFAFTPIGDVIDLPVGSTPVDFAYYVHSSLGDTIVGAKINGIFKSLDTELRNGDVVELESRKNESPNLKWLDFVKTNTARRKIKAYWEKHKQDKKY